MKSKFEKGDEVFDALFGWGEVVSVDDHQGFPICVEYGCRPIYYTMEGNLYQASKPTLSFTEYTLEGFSQERPIELPEVGEEIMVSNDGQVWRLVKFHEIFDGLIYIRAGLCYKHFKRLR